MGNGTGGEVYPDRRCQIGLGDGSPAPTWLGSAGDKSMVGGPTGGAVVTRAELAGESSPGLARSIPEESAATNGLPPPGWDGQPAHVAEWARQLAAAHAVEARAASIAAAADERDRIAIELHHTVIHRLFAAGLTLSSATAYLATIPASEPSAIIANRHIRDAIGILDETIGAIRVAVYHMPDPDLVERD